jgi:serine/threonine protein kinase
MEGGALIGQGTFGCVFSKPLLCKSKKSFKVKATNVGKISEAIDIENEVLAAKILKDIKGQYFVLPYIDSVCKPSDLNTQPDSKSTKDCKFIKKEDIDNILHYTMPYGGVAIRTLFKPLKYDSSPPLNILSFTKHILEGGALLALHGFVHYDIHQENILYNTKILQPSFIDFGMSFSANNISEEVLNTRWKVYSPDWDPEPPEITLITGIRKSIKINDIISDMLKQKAILKYGESLLGLNRQSQLTSFLRFCSTSNSIKNSEWVAFFKSYWSGFDSWGIGVVLVNLLRMVNVYYTNPSDIPGLASVKTVCKGLIQMNPRTRLDCVEALSIVDPTNTILSTATGKAWIKEKISIRKSMKT